MRLDPLVASIGAHIPPALLRPVVSLALRGMEVALCLHRVLAERRAGDPQPELSIPPVELDALLKLLVESRPLDAPRWLTISFDDGYSDAASYVRSRAARFPTVEWLFFLCPQKTERRVGFRWDLPGGPAEVAAPVDVETENQRADLAELAQRPELALSTVEDCRALATLPRVYLGNHTNGHYRQIALRDEEAATELASSGDDFARLFGRARHFAFPFGTPDRDFDARHVALARKGAPELIWSTERRPFRPAERVPGAVLPRFPVNGTWTHRQLALWIAARALVFRRRGSPFRYP